MRICRIQIENYRNLKNIDVQLSNIVTLIGENNSGKSNFLRAISIPIYSTGSDSRKRLSWYDINQTAKNQYYEYLKANRHKIIDGTVSLEEFSNYIPRVKIQLFFQPEEREHYYVKDILIDTEKWIGSIFYQFYIKKPEDLLERVRTILTAEDEDTNIQMSLLPMELFEYSITVPGKGNRVSYNTLSMFQSIDLPAERDEFASKVNRLGSKALIDILQKGLEPESQVQIEKKYYDFFETVKREGKLDSILNWQDYSDIPNAQEFFKSISVLPNMPHMSSILSSIRLGYEDENMFVQGLGHRNLILTTVLLNSYTSKCTDISYRLLTVEEPEAHLCVSNSILMASLFNVFSQKNDYTQIVLSTHNVEFVNKIGLDKIVVLHNGEAFSLEKELTKSQLDYLSLNPNTDIFTLLYSKKVILVEGITEELLIKSYIHMKSNLNDIKVLSFHKGFTKIIDVWEKVNKGSGNKLGIVRDYDDQPLAQKKHDKKASNQIIIRTTNGYTLETDITNANYELLKEKYGERYGWSDLTSEQLEKKWRDGDKASIMIQLCHDLVKGELNGFLLPPHIQEIIDFMQGAVHES